MQVRVLFFGILKDAAGRESEVLPVVEGATASSVVEHYAAAMALAPGLWQSVAFAVNQHYCLPNQVLREGDEVALLPPVSGGRV
jgi:molybdopterin converting factor subunit 1